MYKKSSRTLKRFLGTEVGAFRTLDIKAKALLVSFCIGAIANPVFTIFVNAFLLREYTGFTAPILYNIGMFAGIWAGAFLNGIFLRKLSSARLYFIGTVLESVALLFVIIASPESLYGIFAAGLVYGIGVGVYYGNRNFLTLSANKDEGRDYFVALELASSKIVGIIAPAIIGWLIVFGEANGLYSIDGAYKGLAVFAFVLQVLSGWVVTRHSYPIPSVSSLSLRKADSQWQRMRLLAFVIGMFNGTDWFVPSLLVLTLVGSESELGILQSVGTALTALILYWIGRRTAKKHRTQVLVGGVLCICLGTGALMLSYSETLTITRVLIVGLGTSLFSQAWSTLLYMAADNQTSGDQRYAKILDHELLLNFGRIVGASLLLFILFVVGQQAALQFVPFLLAVMLIVTIPLSRRISNPAGSVPRPS